MAELADTTTESERTDARAETEHAAARQTLKASDLIAERERRILGKTLLYEPIYASRMPFG